MRKQKKKPVIILFAAALIILYIIIYIIPTVTGALISSYTIEYGQLKVADEVTGYIVRDEQVYTAARGGTANRYIKNGTLIRVGTTVMEVSGDSGEETDSRYASMLTRLGDAAISTDSFKTEDGGIISYYADGFESRLTPKTMKNGSFSYYSKLDQTEVFDLKTDSVAAGDPVFKVVDRTLWYIVCFVDLSHMDRYEKGRSVTVEFEDDFVEAEVYSVQADKDKESGKARVILLTDSYYEKYTQLRACPVTLVTYEDRGLLVENGSISKKNGQQGVYVKNKSKDFVFVPIKVYATDGEYSLVADTFFDDAETGKRYTTVEIYDEVLKDGK